mgnify:CR=1 FL=1
MVILVKKLRSLQEEFISETRHALITSHTRVVTLSCYTLPPSPLPQHPETHTLHIV